MRELTSYIYVQINTKISNHFLEESRNSISLLISYISLNTVRQVGNRSGGWRYLSVFVLTMSGNRPTSAMMWSLTAKFWTAREDIGWSVDFRIDPSFKGKRAQNKI